MPINIVVLGPLGSGKGTQVPVILKYFESVCTFHYFELGKIFRERAKQSDERGMQIKGFLQRGILVPDDIVIETVVNYLAQIEDACGIVFDGFPRKLHQATVMDDILVEKGQKVDLVIYLDIPEDNVLERIMGRRTCRECGAQYHMIYKPTKMPGICDACGGQLKQRADDTKEESVRERYGWFVKEVMPIVDYYKEKGVLETINGNQAIPRVSFDINMMLKRCFPDISPLG